MCKFFSVLFVCPFKTTQTFCLSEDVRTAMLCKVQLKEKDIQKLSHAIEELYYYEFIIGM